MLKTISPATEKVLLKNVMDGNAPIVIPSGFSRFVPLESLGAGTYGDVSLVLDLKREKTVVVLKRMSKRNTSLVDAEVEVAALKLVLPTCEKSSICFDGFFEDLENYYITTKTDGTDTQTLYDFLYRRRKYPSAWPTIVTVIKNMIQCTRDFFAVGLTHRDLKPGNMIIAEDLTVRSIDFGMACWSNQSCKNRFKVGTYDYLAPEILLMIKPGYSKTLKEEKMKSLTLRDFWKVDIYALGISIYEVLFQQRPFEKHNPNKGSPINVPSSDLVKFYNQWSFSDDISPIVASYLTKEGLSPSYLDKFVKRNPKLRTPFPLPTLLQIKDELQKQEDEGRETEKEEEEEGVDAKIDLTPANLWQDALLENKRHADLLLRKGLLSESNVKTYRSMFVNFWKLLVIDAIEYEFSPYESIDRLKPNEFFYDDLLENYDLSLEQFATVITQAKKLLLFFDTLNNKYGILNNPGSIYFQAAKMVFGDSAFVVSKEDQGRQEKVNDFTQLVEIIMQSKTTLPFPVEANLIDWLQKTKKALLWCEKWQTMVQENGLKKTVQVLEKMYNFELSDEQRKLMQKKEGDELWLDLYFGSDIWFPDDPNGVIAVNPLVVTQAILAGSTKDKRTKEPRDGSIGQ